MPSDKDIHTYLFDCPLKKTVANENINIVWTMDYYYYE